MVNHARLTAADAVSAILNQGQNPAPFRASLASRFRVSVDAIDALIAAAGAPRVVDAETVAHERLSAEHRLRHTAAGRAWNGEEA